MCHRSTPLLRLAFPGFDFLALGFPFLFTSITDRFPLFSRISPGFVMSVHAFSRFRVTTWVLSVSALMFILMSRWIYDFCTHCSDLYSHLTGCIVA